MEYIKWNDELSVGLDSIDNQHKELFRVINAFYNSIADKLGKVAVLQAIKDMENYTITHFTAEEAMMRHAGYAGLEQHMNEHKDFIETVADFRKRYEEGRLLLSLEVSGFIKNWITNHIKKTDQQYKGLL
jgi:hemerythrin-like metal-binding protein